MEVLKDKYQKIWKLKRLSLLEKTQTSHIYRCESKQGDSILKILTDMGVKDELSGTHFLRNFNGIGCAKLFEFDNRALVLEYIDGNNLYQFSKMGHENKASKEFVAIIKKLRTKKIIEDPLKFNSLSSYQDIFEKVIFPNDLNELMEQGEYLFKKLLATSSDEVLLHGDLHHENVKSRCSGEFVCFDPKGVIGDPSYELATTLKNPWDFPDISEDSESFKSRARYFSRELNLPLSRIIGFAYAHLALSIAWAIEEGCSYLHQKNLIKKLELMLPKL